MESPDPIVAAIDQHRQAWDAFQVAPEGEESLDTCCEMHDALDAVLATSCTTRSGVTALVGHLRWWLSEEADFAKDYQPAYCRAEARVAEIVMLVGTLVSDIDGADHIFARLDTANAAEGAHALACEGLDESEDLAVRDCNAACDRAAAARRALLQTEPSTIGGLRALTCYLSRWGEVSAEEGFLHIARSLRHANPRACLTTMGSDR